MLISTFLDDHAEYIWGPLAEPAGTEYHLKQSVGKIEKFLSFADNATKHLEEITSRDIIDFTRYLKRERGVTDNTLNHYRAAIGSMYRSAEEYELITPDQRPNFKNSKVKLQEPRYFTPSELGQIRDYLAGCRHPWLLHMFNIGILTGMRKSEIWKITKESIRMREGKMFVAVQNTKNGYDREVPLSNDAIMSFAAVNWAFPKTRGGKYPEGAHRDAWTEIRRVICSGDKLARFHTTRHSAATTMANDVGANVVLIAEILGHKDLATTKRYVHSKPESLSGIADRMAELHAATSALIPIYQVDSPVGAKADF